AALKLVRLAAGEGRYKIISFNGCFHGRTMGSLSLTPEKYQKGFEPMLDGSVKVDYGDLEAVRAAVDDETAGIFVEPIQGEGGVNVPTKEFMHALRGLCNEKDVLLVCDEVWTAPARTGRWFAYQHYGIAPDVMTLGKAIGGGLPIGVCAASEKYQDVLGPGTHGCTLGGNPLCTAAAAATMRLIAEEDLVSRAGAKGAEITQALRDAKIGCVKEIRGAGLFIGIELDKAGKEILAACMDRGLLINCTRETVLRLAPPLTIEDGLLQEGLDILLDVLKG
ncbi:MAG: aminotransferase class III-fold pyridoxal phosphate-dependent enzyme, partial [Phycisphaerae bacterium]|nr:aminotransferase class III-fold pyridoxal phosphate-dependent enzyme [Phycisphaerae bacterium]